MPATASAGYRGANGRIAITSDWGCAGSYIQTVLPSGRSLMPVGPAPCDAEDRIFHSASWLSEGNELVATLHRETETGSQSRVVFVNADGSNLRELPVRLGEEPHVSPYRRRIVFWRSGAENGEAEVWRANSNGSGRRRLRPGRSPRWSPRAKRIAFVGRDGLFMMEPDGDLLHRVTSAPVWQFDWSPDGKRLAYVTRRENDLYTIRADGTGGLRRLTTTRRRDEFSPAWSPDGRWIAFVRSYPGRDRRYDVRRKRAGGGDSRLVTALPTAREPDRTTLSWQPRPVASR